MYLNHVFCLMRTRKIMLRKIIIKLSKTKDTVLKAATNEGGITYRGMSISMIADFSSELWGPEWSGIPFFKYWKKNKNKNKNLPTPNPVFCENVLQKWSENEHVLRIRKIKNLSDNRRVLLRLAKGSS